MDPTKTERVTTEDAGSLLYDDTDKINFTGDVTITDQGGGEIDVSFTDTGSGISSLSGGDGIDPASIGDGDTVSVAWGDAADLGSTGAVIESNLSVEDLSTAGAADEVAASDGGGGLTMTDPDTITTNHDMDVNGTSIESDIDVMNYVDGSSVIFTGTDSGAAASGHTELTAEVDSSALRMTNIGTASPEGTMPQVDSATDIQMIQGVRMEFSNGYIAVDQGQVVTFDVHHFPSGFEFDITQMGVQTVAGNTYTGLTVEAWDETAGGLIQDENTEINQANSIANYTAGAAGGNKVHFRLKNGTSEGTLEVAGFVYLREAA